MNAFGPGNEEMRVRLVVRVVVSKGVIVVFVARFALVNIFNVQDYFY